MSDLKFERYFFDIVVYRCDPDSFYTERERNVQKHLEWIAQLGGPPREEHPDIYKGSEERFVDRYGTWRYSQAIGWIRLYVLGRQIRGETWFIDAKRIRQDLAKKNFRHFGKAFELSFFPGEDSSANIYDQICIALEALRQEKLFKRRYLDLEEFHNIGPFIDWRGLIGLDQ